MPPQICTHRTATKSRKQQQHKSNNNSQQCQQPYLQAHKHWQSQDCVPIPHYTLTVYSMHYIPILILFLKLVHKKSTSFTVFYYQEMIQYVCNQLWNAATSFTSKCSKYFIIILGFSKIFLKLCNYHLQSISFFGAVNSISILLEHGFCSSRLHSKIKHLLVLKILNIHFFSMNTVLKTSSVQYGIGTQLWIPN